VAQACVQGVASLVASHQALGENVSLIDMHSTLSASTDMNDQLHTNTAGYDKMAQVWFNGINAVVPEPSTFVLFAALGVKGGAVTSRSRELPATARHYRIGSGATSPPRIFRLTTFEKRKLRKVTVEKDLRTSRPTLWAGVYSNFSEFLGILNRRAFGVRFLDSFLMVETGRTSNFLSLYARLQRQLYVPRPTGRAMATTCSRGARGPRRGSPPTCPLPGCRRRAARLIPKRASACERGER
jgi:hypothetical protein